MKFRQVTLPLALEALDDRDFKYLVRVVGLPIGVIQRDDFYGWDWACAMHHVEDDCLEALNRAIHATLETTRAQRKHSGYEALNVQASIDHAKHGAALRKERVDADLGEEDAAEALGLTVEKLALLEAGQLPVGVTAWKNYLKKLRETIRAWRG